MASEELEKIKKELLKVANSSHTVVMTEAIKKASNKEKTRHKHQYKQTISLPAWTRERLFLGHHFTHDSSSSFIPSDINLKTMSLEEQEYLLLEDLLFCCQGIDGVFIKSISSSSSSSSPSKKQTSKFEIDSQIDPSFKELCLLILPLSSFHSSISLFIQEQLEFRKGLVNQALAAAITTIIRDYRVFITQLENEHRMKNLTLHKFWYYIQSSLMTFSLIHSITHHISINKLRGGAVLTLLYQQTSANAGDPKAQQLCFHLTQMSCVPYFDTLEKWIYQGIIVDPYAEFLIEEDESFKKEKLGQDFNDSYWEQRYTISKDNTPVFLESMATKILNTGKYLNVIRQCGREIIPPEKGGLLFSSDNKIYVHKIDQSFVKASSLLLNLLIDEMDLVARLRSLKHYFMLDQGDFIVQFMDLTENELKKPMDEIMLPRLDTLLELSLRTSTANLDPYKDDLKTDLLPYDLVTQLFKILTIETKDEKDYRIDPTDLHLTGLESFAFDYVVTWPVSLVLNKKALTKYQMLSRHLFYSKHVERELCNIWTKDKCLKGLESLQAKSLLLQASVLRQKMLHFIQNFEYYAMFEVIEPYWQSFEFSIQKVTNIDEVLNLHNELLNNCLKDCMLTNPRLLKVMHKLMVVCVTFCNFMQKINTTLSSKIDAPFIFSTADPRMESLKRSTIQKTLTDQMTELSSNENYEQTIKNFDSNFSKHLLDLLDKVVDFSVSNCEPRLINIINRLDYNGFYKKELDKISSTKLFASSALSSTSSSSLSSLKIGAGDQSSNSKLRGSTSSLSSLKKSSISSSHHHHHHHRRMDST